MLFSKQSDYFTLERIMTMGLTRTLWLVVAVLLSVGSFAGGDTAVLCGWLWLAWTFPFGAVWWFYLYDLFRPLAATGVVQVTGTAVVIAAAYWFWLVLIPSLMRRRRLKATGDAL